MEERGEGGGWEGSPHKIIRQEPKRPQMQNIGDGTRKEERKRTKSRMQNQRKVWWLGRPIGGVGPDPGKTHQTRCCRQGGRRRVKRQIGSKPELEGTSITLGGTCWREGRIWRRETVSLSRPGRVQTLWLLNGSDPVEAIGGGGWLQVRTDI